MKRLPTDAEMHEAAERLGVLDADGNVPPQKRAQVAKAVQLAADEDERESTITSSAEAFAQRVAHLERALIGANVRAETTTAVIGAIAAPLWREMKENTAP